MVELYQTRHQAIKGVASGSCGLGGLGGCTTKGINMMMHADDHSPQPPHSPPKIHHPISAVRTFRVSSHSDLYGFAFFWCTPLQEAVRVEERAIIGSSSMPVS
eukprot:4684642-Prorocentrum_lima.AAC.1